MGGAGGAYWVRRERAMGGGDLEKEIGKRIRRRGKGWELGLRKWRATKGKKRKKNDGLSQCLPEKIGLSGKGSGG